MRDRDKVFVEGHTRSLKVSNALEVVDSALPRFAGVAFALYSLFLLFLYFYFCTVHWLAVVVVYAADIVCACICVKNLLLCELCIFSAFACECV